MELLSWGSNQHGQLGTLAASDATTPRKCDAVPITAYSTHARKLLAGGGHSGVLLRDGRLFVWGWNEHGQLGGPSCATIDTMKSATASALPFHVHDAAFGHEHTLLLVKQTVGASVTSGSGTSGNGTSLQPDIETSSRACADSDRIRESCSR